MILQHSVDVYQQMHVLWTKYCTAFDSLDPLQCNNTIYVDILWMSGLSGGFICEFLQICCCLFSCWWYDKDTDFTCCVDCIVRITRISAFQGYMTCSAFSFLVFVSDDFSPNTTRCPAGGTLDS